MTKYRDWAPTPHDPKGAFIHDEQRDWYVRATMRTRDGGHRRFRQALAQLGGESDTVAVHRFGHWACGWYEIILTKHARTRHPWRDPRSRASRELQRLEEVTASRRTGEQSA